MRLGYQHQGSDKIDLTPDTLSDTARDIINIMRDDAFATQRQIANQLNVTHDQHQRAVHEIRNSAWAQDEILHGGLATKYWTKIGRAHV